MCTVQSGAEAAELKFYRVLAKFSQGTWSNVDMAEQCSFQLFKALEQLLQFNVIPSDELVSHLAITINAILCPDYTFLHSLEQRSIPSKNNYDQTKMEKTFSILCDILSRVGFERVHRQINGAHFCTNPNYLFICPRRPPLKKYEFIHHTFVFPTNRMAKYIPLKNLQHVVHNIDDLILIMNLTRNETVSQMNLLTTMQQNMVAEFKGGPNHAYHGPNMIWFAPLPPDQSSHDSQPLSPSLDYKNSCYGCYRFCIPFNYFLKYKTYILGTRKYDDEYCHTIMLTDTNVQNVKFIKELEPISLTKMNIIEETTNGSFQWLCYRDTEKEWDQLDFAVVTNSLKCDPVEDQIRLDFVDHENCIRENKHPYQKSSIQ
ncbi:unnamed protein product [Rotaria sordida]|uniref:Uncharacterized protein n=1 Tax=Rotaria sordida TaxID=392033 RepID=A0A814J183_9BILA|nr:unnamed protein product [Rotaria sordida]CAF1071851.1 unnamed protein product [Rotaria sordida]